MINPASLITDASVRRFRIIIFLLFVFLLLQRYCLFSAFFRNIIHLLSIIYFPVFFFLSLFFYFFFLFCCSIQPFPTSLKTNIYLKLRFRTFLGVNFYLFILTFFPLLFPHCSTTLFSSLVYVYSCFFCPLSHFL
jgi:hypothetical protein